MSKFHPDNKNVQRRSTETSHSQKLQNYDSNFVLKIGSFKFQNQSHVSLFIKFDKVIVSSTGVTIYLL